MGLIRAGDVKISPQPFSMQDIERVARGMLLRARAEADRLLAAARMEADGLRERGRTEGLAQGIQEGLSKGREEGLKAGREQAYKEHNSKLTQLIAALTAVSVELNAARRDLESSAVNDVLNLAIVIAERVTKRQGILDPAVAVANVTEAMKMVVHASDVRIAVHPSQKTVLGDALPHLKMNWPALAHVELIADDSLEPGGCRIFTQNGQIDGDLNEQIRRIAADLLPTEEAAA